MKKSTGWRVVGVSNCAPGLISHPRKTSLFPSLFFPSHLISLNLREKGHHKYRPHFLHCTACPVSFCAASRQQRYTCPGISPASSKNPAPKAEGPVPASHQRCSASQRHRRQKARATACYRSHWHATAILCTAPVQSESDHLIGFTGTSASCPAEGLASPIHLQKADGHTRAAQSMHCVLSIATHSVLFTAVHRTLSPS